METESAPSISAALSKEEWKRVPSEIGKKLQAFVATKFEDLLKSKALSETSRRSAERSLDDYEKKYNSLATEHEQFSIKVGQLTNTVNELQSQLTGSVAEVTKLQNSCSKLEYEVADFRHQRNLAIDERDEALKMIDRRNMEIERLQADMASLTKQLEGAINAKCEAIAEAEEVVSMKLTLEYKEKRIEQERVLLNNQVQTLTEDLNKRTEELLNMRRDNTSRCIQLEAKLSEKTQELTVASEQNKSLMEINKNLITRAEELTEELRKQRELHAKANESFLQEVEAQTKLADLYKSMNEDSKKYEEKLTKALAEVQELLKTATEEYGSLETKHKESELVNAEIIAKKNECIDMLKKELETANGLIQAATQENIEKHIEGLSPTAAAASKLIKSGMTMTEIYSKYVAVTEELVNEKEEKARLNAYLTNIIHEIEDKGPLVKKQREDLENALDNIAELTKHNDDLIAENQQLKESSMEWKRSEGIVSRENARLKKETADLSRQVCYLLQEVENSRAGSSSTSTDQDLSDSINSADIISKRLVTFSDIAELQNTNQRLLALVRELSAKQEEVESLDPAAVAQLKIKLDNMREAHADMLEQQEKHNKMMYMVINQRDMYKTLYTQAVKSVGDEIPMQLDRPFGQETHSQSSKIHDDSEEHIDEKLQDLESQLEKAKKEMENLREEKETYKTEKTANEKILIEQMETMRNEVRDLNRSNIKLTTQIEVNEERFKVMKSNADVYKNQITALEKQNKIYNETIIKHEQVITYLKDETLQCQTKLARAEVMLGNLQKENALLKDAEARLLKEREMNKREAHTQNILQTNIELIKAALERTDAESRIKLESRLDDAHLECSALRRRLQEEQDRFRQLGEHLEKQMQVTREHMEEEKQQADKLRNELAEVREDLIGKNVQIEELTKKLRTSMIIGPKISTEVCKCRELEQMLSESKAEIETLQTKLRMAKEAAEQHYNVAEGVEKQLKEIVEQHDQYRAATDAKVREQEEQIKQLEEKCSELHGEVLVEKGDDASGIYNKMHNIQNEFALTTDELKDTKQKLSECQSEIRKLQENLEEAENKYTKQMMLHSADLQILATIKEDLTKAVTDVEELTNSRDQAVEALEQNKASWNSREQLFENEKVELENRLKNLDSQNMLLLDQIQALSTQLSLLQTLSTSFDTQNQSTGDISKSFTETEDDVKSSEQLLKIIKYLRQEKDIAVSKCEILDAEQVRLKAQHELLGKQLEEAKYALEMERQKSEVSVVTAAKHSEILRKVETLNAITDSNRSLRQERDTLIVQINELKVRINNLEEQIAPLQEQNNELSIKAEAAQTENVSLRGEATRWRQRANMLIEKSNRTSPEDWKKLQNERETLAKQLTIERSNVTKLNDDINNLKQDKTKLEEQLRSVRSQNNSQSEELSGLREELNNLHGQVRTISEILEKSQEDFKRVNDENRVLSEDIGSKDTAILELKNNLAQVRKIAKKYKTQCEEQVTELEELKQQMATKDAEVNVSVEKQEQLRQEGRSEAEERLTQLEQSHKEKLDELSQRVTAATEENENYRKEIETLKQTSLDKEERFKTLFKNAKDRIMSLTEQNNSLKEELNNQERPAAENLIEQNDNGELQLEVEKLRKEKDDILAEKIQEKDRLNMEIETLTQRVNQLQRQLGAQQGSKPSTSSGPTEKSTTEPPTANIKPMSGHSTNTQTQSVPIQPWRSGNETPLASIRPMSMQLRTVAVLPTSQSPSAVMVPPQQQVHTTGSSTVEALSSSPTSSHTDYVPATSSASPAMISLRQVAVPPTHSTQDNEDEDNNMQVQPTTQQQAVALVLPRVEPPSSCPAQEQGTSSSSSNTVTTTQAGLKRPRDVDPDGCQSDEQGKMQQQQKRSRIQQGETEVFQSVSESGLEVEYQVPTSSQRDHEEDTDAVIVVESDEEGEGPDEGEGADDEPDDADGESYDMEGINYPEQELNYDDADCQEVEEDEEEGGNEVEVIEDSSEVPNQSERSVQDVPIQEENPEQAQSEATSSGTDGGSTGITLSQASTSVSMTMPCFSRTRPVAPLSRQQQSHLLLPHGLEEGGDDGIVPSTPTLYVPRRSDGFGEAVSSPHVPTSGRFTFNESAPPSSGSSNEIIIPEQTLEIANIDDNSTGRSVPSTPLQASPQEATPAVEEQSSQQSTQSDAEIPAVTVSGEAEQAPEGSSGECMGPPAIVAGTSGEASQPSDQSEEMLEGEDGVSSEGEKPPAAEEAVEEGREAEASPSSNTRTRSQTNRGNTSNRRSIRHTHQRGMNRANPPTPIIWERSSSRSHQGSHQDMGRGGGRGNIQQHVSYTPRGARRSRGRGQRPYTRF